MRWDLGIRNVCFIVAVGTIVPFGACATDSGSASSGAPGASGESTAGSGAGASFAGASVAGTSSAGVSSAGAAAGGAGTSGPQGGSMAGAAGAPGTAGTVATAGTAGAGGAPTGGSGQGTTLGGFGRNTPAGRGGAVIKVTTLAADGPGSLRAALATAGPRIIVFEVGGVIDLNRIRLDVNEPFVTVAGQTAPAPGITLIRGGLRVTTHDVLVQHVRVRMGDAGAAAASGFEPDVTTDGASAYNIVFDHVSVAWGVDENLSVSGPRLSGPMATSRRVTISNSIIAEGLRNSIHEKVPHSMGTLIHDYCTEVAVVGNLYAHNDERNPWFKGFATGVVVNNVVYNPGKWAMRLGPVDSEWAAANVTPEGPRVSIVGNYMRHGPSTPAGLAMVGSNSRGSAYLEDNIAVDTAGADVAIAAATVTELSAKPIWPEGLEARPAASVVEWVLAHAGARPKERDAVDTRIVEGFRAGTGALIDSQEAVGGYPVSAPTERALVVPEDVDTWLRDLAAALE